MADLYGDTIGGGSAILVDAHARTLKGDGALGAGPYTSFGTRQLQAIKVVSATVDFSSTSNYVDGSGVPIVNGAFYKAVNALMERAEVYYVGIPGNTATGFTALISSVNSDSGDAYGASSSADGTYDNLEEVVDVAVNGSDSGDITISNVTLSGLTFA